MNLLVPYKSLKNSNPLGADFTTMAERELSAFFNAVTVLFGAKQAVISAEDWLHDLIEIDGLPASPHEWKLITARASTRLANRVHGLSLSTKFINA